MQLAAALVSFTERVFWMMHNAQRCHRSGSDLATFHFGHNRLRLDLDGFVSTTDGLEESIRGTCRYEEVASVQSPVDPFMRQKIRVINSNVD